MGKIFTVFLLILLSPPALAAVLQGVGDVERCWYDSSSYEKWFANCGGTVVSGDGLPAQESGVFGDVAETLTAATEETEAYCWCRMTSPYTGMYVFVKDISYVPSVMRSTECVSMLCKNLWIGDNCMEKGYDDDCSDYGVGLFSNEGEQEAFLSALFSTPQTPCEIGISKLMVGTGDSFALWAEKYTEPSLVIGYNDQKCYAKLEQGAGTLNIKFNGVVYHVVE